MRLVLKMRALISGTDQGLRSVSESTPKDTFSLKCFTAFGYPKEDASVMQPEVCCPVCCDSGICPSELGDGDIQGRSRPAKVVDQDSCVACGYTTLLRRYWHSELCG